MTGTSRSLTLTGLLTLLGCAGDDVGDGHAPSDAAPKGVELATSKLERVLDPSEADVGALGAGNAAFAFDLLPQVVSANPGANVVFSPYSLATALAMTYAGARGQTADEIRSTMHFELEQSALHAAFNAVDLALATRGQGAAGVDGTPFRLRVNNSLWAHHDDTVVPAFLDTLALNYGAGVFLVDFSSDPEGSRKVINLWVDEKTEGMITELLPAGSIKDVTRFVLTNTVYFNASWETLFREDATQPAPFVRLDGTSVDVPTMNSTLEQYAVRYAQGEGYEAIALPYASTELAFIAVLPDAGAYETVERGANAAWFAELRSRLASAAVQLSLPKFTYRTATSVKEALNALGMTVPFSTAADFSGMTPADVYIDDVLHQAVIDVGEAGTKAAAATAVTFARKSAVLDARQLRFDRPFLYAIVDEPTGQILFMGRVLDPSRM